MKFAFSTLVVALVAAPTASRAVVTRPSLDVPKGAHQAGAEDKGEPRVHAYLMTDVAAVTPGESFRVGVLFLIDEHYHIYWKNPGQAALATDVRFSGDGLSFDALQWPAPAIFKQADGFITTYGYANEVLLFTQATVAEGAHGELTVQVKADYLACKVDCTPGEASLSRAIPLRGESTPAAHAVVQLFDRHAARVPKTADALGVRVEVAYDVSAVKPNTRFAAALGIVSCAGPSAQADRCPIYQVPGNAIDDIFAPERTPGIEWKAVAAREHPSAYSGLVVDIVGKSGPDEPEGNSVFAGVLELEREDGTPALVQFSVPLARASSQAVVAAQAHPLLPAAALALSSSTGPPPPAIEVPVWQMLLLAFLGGLVLNLMPCVLPVLAIKVTGYTQLAGTSSKHGRAVVFGHSLAYTGGILAAMAALACAVVLLRAGGHAVGWGFQFQEPLFVTVVAGVLTVFALSLFGVFDIGAGGVNVLGEAVHKTHGPLKSALEGVLAVAVATPCSAPFLGTAVGFALAREAWLIVVTFLAIGAGLAAPFVVLTSIPGALSFMPKPGLWMVRLKQVMGFALLATVLWLAWVVGKVAGVDGMAAVMGFALAAALATWLVAGVQGNRRWPARVAALAVLTAGLVVSLRTGEASQPEAMAPSELGWQPFAPETVTSELARGKVVFVDFTADWCITCKVNERAVLSSDRVAALTKKLEVVMLKADWTRRDERIRSELARYGKAGVPMYLVYSPSKPDEPAVLPELLTTDLVVTALQQAHGG
ncbi:MAG: protein-disulfide reductase DsbD family protein [Myxococcota bacterium]